MPRGKGGGRRVRQAGKPLSKNLTFRLDAELDRQLRKAAVVAGRSVSEEIQYRLRRSFEVGADFQSQVDYRALSSLSALTLTLGDLMMKEGHHELKPLIETARENLEKGEEKK
jgi:HKD family nuclease